MKSKHIESENDGRILRTFSANFSSKPPNSDENPKNAATKETNRRISKKYLIKKNQRLTRINDEILSKFNELEELSLKKITKSKNKIFYLQKINEELSIENNHLKMQNDKLTNKNCENCVEMKLDLEKYESDLHVLEKLKIQTDEDVKMLKNIIFRLNLQIERYQDKMQQINIPIPVHSNLELTEEIPSLNASHAAHSHTPISWGRVNSHTIGPLLTAYDEALDEKQQIIDSYELELSNFTGKFRSILKENENLYRNLYEDKESSVQLKSELDKLKKDCDFNKNQNEILRKNCALKQDKFDEIVKCYENKVEQLKRDYSIVHEQYCQNKGEISVLLEKNKILENAQNDLKKERENYIPLSIHTGSIEEFKKLREQFLQEHNEEKKKLKENIDNFLKEINDLKEEKQNFAREKIEMDNKVKCIEKQIKKDEKLYIKFERTLMEVELSKNSCMKQLRKVLNFAKELVVEQEILLQVLNQSHRENKVVKKMGIDITTRMEALKAQLKNVQKEAGQELISVEKRMTEQSDVIRKMKLKHDEEIEKLQKIIRENEIDKKCLEKTPSISHYRLYKDKYK